MDIMQYYKTRMYTDQLLAIGQAIKDTVVIIWPLAIGVIANYYQA